VLAYAWDGLFGLLMLLRTAYYRNAGIYALLAVLLSSFVFRFLLLCFSKYGHCFSSIFFVRLFLGFAVQIYIGFGVLNYVVFTL
jgi:hypothetical protein